jgi:hypothetical protein
MAINADALVLTNVNAQFLKEKKVPCEDTPPIVNWVPDEDPSPALKFIPW